MACSIRIHYLAASPEVAAVDGSVAAERLRDVLNAAIEGSASSERAVDFPATTVNGDGWVTACRAPTAASTEAISAVEMVMRSAAALSFRWRKSSGRPVSTLFTSGKLRALRYQFQLLGSLRRSFQDRTLR